MGACCLKARLALPMVMAYQLHGTGIFLIIPLALATFFAWHKLVPIAYHTIFNLSLLAFGTQESPKTILHTASGQSALTLPVSASSH